MTVAPPASSPVADAAPHVTARTDHVELTTRGRTSRFHHVWLRDNCACASCRVTQSGERALFTADIPDDIAPTSIECTTTATEVGGDRVDVEWNDGHRSSYSLEWLLAHDYSTTGPRPSRPDPTLWRADLGEPPTFAHHDVVATREGQIAYLDAVRVFGVALVRGTPCVDGEVERFAEALGHVRETAFERVHNVRHDPSGYNVAHTAVELKPHTDLPSYHWPPSIQLLHFVQNDATGGESTVTDGWAVAADLRREDPVAFEVLTRFPVGYQLFGPDENTSATAPMIQLDTAGQVTTFRFSNQLAQPVDAGFEEVGEFYRAYRLLGRMIDGRRYKVAFRARSGDLLTVHGHRVMHGRLAFDPASGGRHLQDVYMEYDDLMGRRRVLSGEHVPPLSDGVRHG